MTRINEEHFEAASLEQLKQRDPIDSRRFHRDSSNLAVVKPIAQIMQVTRKCSEGPHGVLRPIRWNCNVNLFGADVDPCSIRMQHRKHTSSCLPSRLF